MERKRLEFLLGLGHLTMEQFEELRRNEYVNGIEQIGKTDGYLEIEVTYLQQGYLPYDETYYTERKRVFVKDSNKND